ncbi:transposase [Burkholderia sp. LMG 32019]|uniref:transposase n=1 Tax=Burkholderia sp. LMG 32019 TaxID=3158173 RepID=UPI003C30CB91
MTEKRNLRSRLVISRKRDGRREYDDAARDEPVRLCLQPGASIARTAMEHDLDPKLLCSWVARHQKIQAQIEHERVARTPMVADGVSIELDLHDVVQCLDRCDSWLGDPERIDNLKHQRGQRRIDDLLSGKREFKQGGNIDTPFRGVHDGDKTAALARHIDQ